MKKKICKNCKHYSQQYMFNCGGKVITSGFGMCNNDENKYNPPRTDRHTCKNYEQRE